MKKSEHEVAIFTRARGRNSVKEASRYGTCCMDLGKKESQVAIITEAGELIEKR
jgi:hypothetical protein